MSLSIVVSVGPWKCHGEAGAHLPREPGPYGPRLGSGPSSLFQGGADPEHGPRGQGDYHGGAADMQASQKTGLYTYGSGRSFEFILACFLFRNRRMISHLAH